MTVIEALRAASKRSPYERGMQLIFNALDQQGLARNRDGSARDVFYVSDDDLIRSLQAYQPSMIPKK